MDRSYPSNWGVWEAATTAILHDAPVLGNGCSLPGPHNPADFAERLYACEALQPPCRGPLMEQATEPYSLQWFLSIENHRHARQGPWIPKLLEFAKHAHETLLGLGNGLGTDWLQYARHGAEVIICSPSVEQLALIRRNFELRGLRGRFLRAGPGTLPLETASIDVACLSSLAPDVTDPERVIREIYRVLKPGGKVLAVTLARYDIDFWHQVCFPWRRWLGPKTPKEDHPPVRFSARKLRRMFGLFVDHRIYKRQLRRSETPHLWRWLPRTFLERLMGHFLIVKAFKPLSSAMTMQAAA